MSKGSMAGTGPLARAVATEIRAEMARQGLTNQALANRTGMSMTYVGKRLRGEFAFTLNELEPVAAALKTTAADLFQRGLDTVDRYRADPTLGAPPSSDQ